MPSDVASPLARRRIGGVIGLLSSSVLFLSAGSVISHLDLSRPSPTDVSTLSWLAETNFGIDSTPALVSMPGLEMLRDFRVVDAPRPQNLTLGRSPARAKASRKVSTLAKARATAPVVIAKAVAVGEASDEAAVRATQAAPVAAPSEADEHAKLQKIYEQLRGRFDLAMAGGSRSDAMVASAAQAVPALSAAVAHSNDSKVERTPSGIQRKPAILAPARTLSARIPLRKAPSSAPVSSHDEPVANVTTQPRSYSARLESPVPAAPAAVVTDMIHSSAAVEKLAGQTDTGTTTLRMIPAKRRDQIAAMTIQVSTPPGRSNQPTKPTPPIFHQNQVLPLFYEAFDPANTAVPQATPDPYTREFSSKGDAMGWEYVTAPQHWAALSWAELSSSPPPVPMLSVNTLRLLETLTGVSIQKSAGVVFGKVPAGYEVDLRNVEYSDRAARPFYMNLDRQVVGPEAITQTRYFIFVNVAPGAHLLYFDQKVAEYPGQTLGTGTVGIPVARSTSTYVDGRGLMRRTIQGYVFAGESREMDPLAGVQVSVVGQDSGANAKVVYTETGGSFAIPEVTVLEGYPVYLESQTEKGYKHRFRFMPSDLRSVQLFQFSARQIEAKINQLENGVSASSGMVIASVRGLVKKFGKIDPIVRPINDSTLTPESYPLAPNGQLLADQPCNETNTRFFATQIPEGPALVQVENSAHKTVWSELFIASPGVVNVFMQ